MLRETNDELSVSTGCTGFVRVRGERKNVVGWPKAPSRRTFPPSLGATARPRRNQMEAGAVHDNLGHFGTWAGVPVALAHLLGESVASARLAVGVIGGQWKKASAKAQSPKALVQIWGCPHGWVFGKGTGGRDATPPRQAGRPPPRFGRLSSAFEIRLLTSAATGRNLDQKSLKACRG